MPTDVLILDANCFKHLENQAVASLVTQSLRATGLVLWPTALNALELAKTRNAGVRRRALATAARFLADRPLLPLPDDVLRRAGEAALQGRDYFQFGDSGFEWMLSCPGDVKPQDVGEIENALQPSERSLAHAFKNSRPEIRRFIKEHGLDSEWASAQQFLDQQWCKRSQLDTIIAAAWRRFGLPGDAPIDALLQNQVWRLHVEAFGAALFGRVIAKEQMKSVHAWDIAQLVYLGAWRRRILVTEDDACLSVAQAVLHGRHQNARAIRWKEFLDLAST